MNSVPSGPGLHAALATTAGSSGNAVPPTTSACLLVGALSTAFLVLGMNPKACRRVT